MSEDQPTDLWTPLDQRHAQDHGWTIEVVKKGSVGFHHTTIIPHAGAISRDIPANVSFIFAWNDPTMSGKTWDDSLVDFIASEAVKGSPFYERAWLLYCYLDLRGKIRNAIWIHSDDTKAWYRASH